MTAILSFLLSILVPATFIAVGVYVYRERQLARYLSHFHAAVWAGIAPVPGARASVSSPFSKFIQNRAYLQLDDPKATNLGERARGTFYLAITLFFLLLAVFLPASVLKT